MSDIRKDAPMAIRALRNLVADDIVDDSRPYAVRDFEMAFDEFDEDLHPRDETGKFTSGGGSSGSGNEIGTNMDDLYKQLEDLGKDLQDMIDKKGQEIREGFQNEHQEIPLKWQATKEIENRMNDALDRGDKKAYLEAIKEAQEKVLDPDSWKYRQWEGRNPDPDLDTQHARQDVKDEIMKNLSPNELRDIYRYCKGRSDEELEGYFDPDHVSKYGRGVDINQHTEMQMRKELMSLRAQWDKIDKLDHPLSEQEAVDKIAFWDREGYCVSQAQAYLLNRAGYDVQDGKDEASRGSYSRMADKLAAFANAKTLDDRVPPREVVKFLKENVEPGKEYYFHTYCHAAPIRKQDGKLQYLETQNKEDNGWKNITATEMKSRFGYKTGMKAGAVLIDGNELTSNPAYIRQSGYINNLSGIKGGYLSNKTGAQSRAEFDVNKEMKTKEAREKRALAKNQIPEA